jgi:D-3-phosphoglycerate dehydrogenase
VAQSDVISLHAPLTGSTRGLFGRALFAACRPGVLLVNCARGGLVDESALLEALNTGQVGGAALDVYSQEPPPEELRPLFEHPNVVCTPHIAASTSEAQQKVAVQVTEQVVRGLRGETVATPVNASAIRLSSRPEVKPFVALAELLGRIVARLNAPHAIKRVTIRGAGEIPRAARDVLAVGALAGVLGELLDDRVNLVNAESLAEEAGLPVHTDWVSTAENYQHYVEVDLETAQGERSIRGTLFGGVDARIIGLDRYELELRPAGTMLFYRNVDRPGMLAAVGAIVAAANVNIGAMSLGRRDPGAPALTVMHLDERLGEADLALIGGVAGLEDVRQVDI